MKKLLFIVFYLNVFAALAQNSTVNKLPNSGLKVSIKMIEDVIVSDKNSIDENLCFNDKYIYGIHRERSLNDTANPVLTVLKYDLKMKLISSYKCVPEDRKYKAKKVFLSIKR